MEAGFSPPDWNAPLDVETYLREAPRGGAIKGMFFADQVEMARKAGKPLPGRKRYFAFKDYPIKEYMELLLETAELVHPGVPIREALRRLGRPAYPTLADTMIGRAIFALAGDSFHRILAVASKAYAVSVKPGKVDLVSSGDNWARMELRTIWAFPDCYQVGVFEGGMEVLGLYGTIQVRTQSLCDVDFHLEWTDRGRRTG